MKKALLIVGHGSRAPEAKKVFEKIVHMVREMSPYDLVEGAFMELSEPDIPLQVEKLIEKGSGEIIIVPHFLYEGIHIKEDIPEIINDLSDKYKNVIFKMARPIGADPALAGILISRAEEAIKLYEN